MMEVLVRPGEVQKSEHGWYKPGVRGVLTNVPVIVPAAGAAPAHRNVRQVGFAFLRLLSTQVIKFTTWSLSMFRIKLYFAPRLQKCHTC